MHRKMPRWATAETSPSSDSRLAKTRAQAKVEGESTQDVTNRRANKRLWLRRCPMVVREGDRRTITLT